MLKVVGGRHRGRSIATPEGVVLVVGCAHTGLDNILKAAAAIRPEIRFVAGGFHYVASKDADIETLVTVLRDTCKVATIAPGHCTGEPTFAALQKAFGDRYLYAGLGNTLSIDANPRAASIVDGSRVLDDGDSRSYRTLVAQSDDLY